MCIDAKLTLFVLHTPCTREQHHIKIPKDCRVLNIVAKFYIAFTPALFLLYFYPSSTANHLNFLTKYPSSKIPSKQINSIRFDWPKTKHLACPRLCFFTVFVQWFIFFLVITVESLLCYFFICYLISLLINKLAGVCKKQ